MKAQLSGNPQKGFSTLEILIAFAILTLSMTAIIMVVFGNQSIAVDTQTNVEALGKAQALLEQTRALSRQDFSLAQSIATTSDDIYKKSVTVVPIDSSTKQATSFVSWLAGSRVLLIQLSTVLTDWLHPAPKCFQMLSGDWTTPQVYGYVDFASSAGGTGVYVGGTKAYVTSDPSSPGTDDFYIIDVNNPSPAKGALPILSEFSTSYGLTGVQVSGTYAYVVAHSQQYQLLVIDISDSNNLDTTKIKAKLDVTVPGDTAYGSTLTYDNKKIYLGTTISSANGPEFHIIDVSNPVAPKEVGPGFKVGAKVSQILVSNNLAHLVTASTTPVFVLDVSNPNAPLLAGSYTAAPSVLSGQSIAFSGAQLYVGRTGGNANPKLFALATSTISNTLPSTPPVWSMNMKKQSGVFTMVVRNPLLFMTTSDPKDGLQIWDVSNPLVAPTRYDTNPLNIQQGGTAGSDCSGNLLYVAQRSNRAMQIIGPS